MSKLPRRGGQALISFLLLIFFIGINTNGSLAQIKTFYWERFDVDITLLENGDLRVEETQVLYFEGEPFTFGFSTIPTGNKGNNDGIVDIRVQEGDFIYTQDSSRRPGTFIIEEESDEVIINWYFEPAIGRHVYTFSYTVLGGVHVGDGSSEDNGDQVFWKAIPEEHSARIEASQVVLRLPQGVQPQTYYNSNEYLVAAYINAEETDTIDIDVSEDGRIITYQTNEILSPNAQLEVRVQFPHGLLSTNIPQWQQRQQAADTINLALVTLALCLLLAGPLAVLTLWYSRGRDPHPEVVVPDYISEPPDNLPPAVVGTLIDEKADMHDILSTLVDLARRGYLLIEENKGHKFIRTDKSDEDLRPFEQEFLRGVFRGKMQQTLSSLRYKFSDKLPQLRQLLYEELVENGLVPYSPESVRNNYGCAAFALFAMAAILFFAIPVFFADNEAVAASICPTMAVGLTGLVLLITSRFMPVKTRKGAEAAAKWEAFKTYLKTIEKYENLPEVGDIFEAYLPYAVAFGLERTWIRKFAAVPSTPVPPWYGYPHRPLQRGSGQPIYTGGDPNTSPSPSLEGMSGSLAGGLASMSSSLTRMLNSSATTLKSVKPSNSSTGSFSSGGFSGGGFGSSGGGSRGFG